MKKIISLMLIAIMLFSFGVANASSLFSDLKGTEWFYEDLGSLVELKAISGYTDGTFKPNNKVSRAEFIKILITAIGETPGNNTGHWASGYINKAEVLGLINNGTYQGIEGDKIISRNEIAKIMSIADNILFESIQNNFNEVDIKDLNLIPTEYKEYVKDVYLKGIIAGFPDGRFGGNEGISRAEASVIALRLVRPEKRVGVASTDNNIPVVIIPEDNEYFEPEQLNEEIVENTDESLFINGKYISKAQVVEELKSYYMEYPREYYEQMHAAQPEKLGYLGILQDMDYLHDTVNSYMNNMFNRDYTSINGEDLKGKSLKAIQNWWYYKDILFSPEEFFNEWVKDTKSFNIKQEAYFVTDPSLVQLVNLDGYRVRGRLYFKYVSHNNPSNIQYELETSDKIEVGKWYSVDIDIRCINAATNAPIVDRSGVGGIHFYSSEYYLNDLTEFK